MTELVDLSSRQVVVEDEVIPDDIPLMQLADRVVRGKVQLSQQQMRMLIEMLPYIAPKLSATANVTVDGSFAQRLERAIERSQGPPPQLNGKTIEHEPQEHEELVSASEMRRPFQTYRRS
jgi:hypothetical protein